MSPNPQVLKFRVPLESPAPSLGELVKRAWPEGTDDQIARLFERNQVCVDTIGIRQPNKVVAEDFMVTIEVEEGDEVFGLPEGDSLARGDGWIVVHKPTGMPGTLDREDPMDSVLFLADMLGLERDTFTPVWEMPIQGGGPWLFGLTPEDAGQLRAAYTSGELMMTWVALVARPTLAQGTWTSPEGLPVDYSTTTTRGGICEVQLTPRHSAARGPLASGPVDQVLGALAEAGHPALGDRERGGYMIEHGLRLRLAALFQPDSDLAYSWPAPQDWWPEHSVAAVPEAFQKPDKTAETLAPNYEGGPREVPMLVVSPKTLEVLEKSGHPWVFDDAQTGRRDHLAPGTPVQLRSPTGDPGPVALIEGKGDLAARVWSKNREDAEYFEDEIDIRVDEAIAARGELLRSTTRTDVFRLIHSEADGLPGLLLDRMGTLLRATIVGKTAEGLKERVYHNMILHDPDMPLLEVEHVRDVREGEGLPQARVVHKGGLHVNPEERLVVLEDGLRYWCEPWQGIDVGFFADQRENRRRLVAKAGPGQRWLNLFCHTGAFSVALAKAGAHVVSVDLSRRYLKWLEANLDLNHIDRAMNTSVAADCRDYLRDYLATEMGDGGQGHFDGIIVDPPTAAAGEKVFWSVRKDYEKLLVDCFRVLAANGTMLVCRNDRKRTPSLETVIKAAAKSAGWKIGSIQDAPPAEDFPRMKGFPEGDSFEGLLISSEKGR